MTKHMVIKTPAKHAVQEKLVKTKGEREILYLNLQKRSI